MKHFYFAFFFFYAASCCHSFGQRYLHTYDQFDHTPGMRGSVNCAVQDTEGFLWLGTEEGLFRFDGVHARKLNYLVSDTLQEKTSDILSMALHSNTQTLWISTGYGIFKYNLRSGQSTHLVPSDFFDHKEVGFTSHEVFIDRQGQVWADFGGNALAHFTNGDKAVEWFTLPLTSTELAAGFEEDFANEVRTITQDANDEEVLWIAARRGLMKFDKRTKRLERFFFHTENKEMLIDANVHLCIYPHQNGFIYLGTWDAGLLKFDPRTGSFSQFFTNEKGWTTEQNKNRISSLIADEKGRLWVNSSEGGSLFDVDKERFLSTPNKEVAPGFKDKQGNYWSFQQGVRLFHHLKNQLEMHPKPDSVELTHLNELLLCNSTDEAFLRAHSKGGVWAILPDQQSWKYYPLPGRQGEQVALRSFGESRLGCFITDDLDRLYLCPLASEKFRLLPVVFPPMSGNMNMAVRKDGDLFITGHEGWLFWIKSGTWELKSFFKSTSNPLHCASSPVFDHLGRLWMRTCEGFCIFSPEEERFLHVSKSNEQGKHLADYRAFLPDGQGRMWASGEGGFGWIDPLKPSDGLQKHYKPKRGILGNFAYLLSHAGSKIWLQTTDDLLAFDTKTEEYRSFKILDSPTGTYNLLQDGRWLSLKTDGYFLCDPDSLQSAEERPQPYVSWFKVFEKPLALHGEQLAPDEILLKPEENFFSFGFSAVAWYDPGKIRFAYRLEGVNKDWVYPEEGVFSASFNNVEGGNYVLKIKSTDSQGKWLDNVYSLKIHVGTPWWKTWWARLLTLATLGITVFLIVKNHLHQQQIQLENQRLLLEKETALRNERDRIASDIHDDLGAGLSTIRFLSLAAKEREANPEKAARIDQIASQSSQVMEKMADIIWVMNSRNDSLENFAAYIRRYAAELLDTHGIQLHFVAPPAMPTLKLSGEQRRSLLLTVKECLHNVVKHASATSVSVVLAIDKGIVITIHDNGKGLPHDLFAEVSDPQKPRLGNGLFNIRQRMEALGGEVVLENGKGLKINLRIPLAAE